MSTATIATSSPRRNPRPARAPRRRRLHLVPTVAPSPAAPATIAPPSGIVATAEREDGPAEEAPATQRPGSSEEPAAGRRAPWQHAARLERADGRCSVLIEDVDYSAESLAMAAEEIHRVTMTLAHMLNSIRTENYDALDEEVLRAIDAAACADLYLSGSYDALRLAAGLEGYDVVRVDRINRPHLVRRDDGRGEKGGAR